ncbi:hypothetical protein [uncultured Gimesia sp.]|uniref:hypothetical protein n=1 Tax=uncultured Gimesia sp. TaxID=1678688 RepID=UPI0026215CDB|nr:hypothetical protein [uncultured Gimesia sp.]
MKKFSRAHTADLEFHDLIRIVNGKLLRTPADADNILQKITYKDELKLGVIRLVENKWKRIEVTMEPISELDYLRSNLLRYRQIDYDYSYRKFVRHPANSISKFENKNFQLNYTSTNSGQPITIYLQLSLFLPEKSSYGDTSMMYGFIIKTDTTKYRIVDISEIDVKKRAFKKRLAEAKKLIQATQTKVDEADSKNKAKEEVTKLLKELALAREQYQEIQTAQTEFLKFTLKQKEQSDEESRKRFNIAYDSQPKIIKDMLNNLVKKLETGADIPESDLLTLEDRGLGRQFIDMARILQGWKLYDRSLKKSQLKMIEDIISSNKVTVHYETVPDKTFEVTPEQKEGMKIVLKVFKADGGKLAE